MELRARILHVLVAALGCDTAVEVFESYEAKLIEEFARPRSRWDEPGEAS
jgi:hypothetical protein